jgi:calcium binding protein 39
MADPSAPKTPFDWLQGGLFFGKNNKGGTESIDSCKDATVLLKGISSNLADILATLTPIGGVKENEEAEASNLIAARLSRLRFLLYDERRITSQQDSWRSNPTIAGNTIHELTNDHLLQDLIPSLLGHMIALPFESRKHVAAIFNYLLVCGLDGSDAEVYRSIMTIFLRYVHSRFDSLMQVIVDGHDTTKHGAADVGLHFGSMYRSCMRHPFLYKELVGTSERAERFVFPFLDTFVHVPNFEISSDSMESLRQAFNANNERILDEEISRTMAQTAAEFLTRDYEAIWDQRYNPKLLSDEANYMTRRVALQILSTVLLTRSNYAVMIKYVASRINLILVMKLLRDTSPHITLDAFHVFKVFVANPNKPPEVIKILKDNQVKLCRYLQTLHQDKEESDAQFRDEKALIIATIEGL